LGDIVQLRHHNFQAEFAERGASETFEYAISHCHFRIWKILHACGRELRVKAEARKMTSQADPVQKRQAAQKARGGFLRP
jgi:hypothetical protein